MVGIYKITNPIGEIYIGKSKDIPRRFKGYKSSGAKSQPKLSASFIKYGIESHLFEIVQECDLANINQMEIYFINHFNSINGLNAKIETNLTPPKFLTKQERDDLFKDYLKKQLLKNPIGKKPNKNILRQLALKQVRLKSYSAKCAKLVQNGKHVFDCKSIT